MIPLGLSGPELRAFNDHLASHHTQVTTVTVQDLDGDTLENVTEQVVDGQVNVDADAEVTRSLNLTMSDPARTLDFDGDSPLDGTLYLDRMIHVEQSYLVPSLGRVDVPIFTGPVVKFDRSGDEVSLEGHGKEALALNEAWRPMSFKTGKRTTAAIREVLQRTGETRFSFPDAPKDRLPEPVNLGRMSKPWKVARQLAASLDDAQLLYDGDGVCRLREKPNGSCYEFRSHVPDANITGAVQITKDAERLKNLVWVKGGKLRGNRRGNASAVAVAPRNHPLSPWSLGRNDEPRYYVHVIENDNLRTSAAAQRVADRVLEDLLLDMTEVTLEVIPVPHLEPLDVVHVETDRFSANIRLRKFSLPIRTGGPMTIGTHRRVSVNRRRIRR